MIGRRKIYAIISLGLYILLTHSYSNSTHTHTYSWGTVVHSHGTFAWLTGEDSDNPDHTHNSQTELDAIRHITHQLFDQNQEVFIPEPFVTKLHIKNTPYTLNKEQENIHNLPGRSPPTVLTMC